MAIGSELGWPSNLSRPYILAKPPNSPVSITDNSEHVGQRRRDEGRP